MPEPKAKKEEKPEMEDRLYTKAEMEALAQKSNDYLATALRQQAQMIADALRDSKKPYVSEAQLQNEEDARKANFLQQQKADEGKRQEQENCPHMQGCSPNSDSQGDRTCIAWHRNDVGAIQGICLNCQKQFRQEQPDFMFWFRKTKGGKMSAAGQRFIK